MTDPPQDREPAQAAPSCRCAQCGEGRMGELMNAGHGPLCFSCGDAAQPSAAPTLAPDEKDVRSFWRQFRALFPDGKCVTIAGAAMIMAAEIQWLRAAAPSSDRVCLVPALEQCARWFHEYAEIHRRKGDADKEKRNRERAEFCEAVLSTLAAAPSSAIPCGRPAKGLCTPWNCQCAAPSSAAAEPREFDKHYDETLESLSRMADRDYREATQGAAAVPAHYDAGAVHYCACGAKWPCPAAAEPVQDDALAVGLESIARSYFIPGSAKAKLLTRAAARARRPMSDEQIIEAVEREVGMGHGAWDMVSGSELVAAFRKVLAGTVPAEALAPASERAPMCDDGCGEPAVTTRTSPQTGRVFRLCATAADAWDDLTPPPPCGPASERAPTDERLRWAQPADLPGRTWLLKFEDPDVNECVFYDEAEARAMYDVRRMSWNCYLFAAVERVPASERAEDPDTWLAEANAAADRWVVGVPSRRPGHSIYAAGYLSALLARTSPPAERTEPTERTET